MATWTVYGWDPDYFEDGRGRIAEMHGATRVEALLRGCEAVADGWVEVVVEGPLGSVYPVVDPATAVA